jgi:hypothetical protein
MAASRTEARDFVLQLLSTATGRSPSEISEDDDLRTRLHLDEPHLSVLATQINQQHWRGVVLLPAEMRACRTVRDVIDLVWKQASRARRSARAPPPAPGSRHELDQGDYLVWYGTNRRLRDPGDPQKGYSAERDRDVFRMASCQLAVANDATRSLWLKIAEADLRRAVEIYSSIINMLRFDPAPPREI